MKGTFITIYGINNIGKTTQAKILAKNLKRRGLKVKFVKFPRYDLKPTGPFINKVLRGSDGQKISEDELQLWFILNRYQAQNELKTLLNQGYIIIAEDYTGTGIAWGMAKGCDEKWLTEGNKFLLKEDLAIFLYGKRHEHAKERVHVHEQNDSLIKKSDKAHFHLAEKYKWRKISVNGPILVASKLILKEVDDFLKHR